MVKYIYEKHPKLLSFAVILCIGVLVYGGLLIADTIQKEQRAETQYSLDLEKKEGIKAYDVEGLTDEEIDALLERGE